MAGKALARQERRLERAHKKSIGQLPIRLTGADMKSLTGITIRQLSAWKRHGHMESAIPARVPSAEEAADTAVVIIGFRDLIAAKIVQFLMALGLSFNAIFRSRAQSNSNPRGLYALCEAALKLRHGCIDQFALVLSHGGDSHWEVAVTHDWPNGQAQPNGTHVLDFRQVVPELLRQIAAIKGRPIGADVPSILGPTFPRPRPRQ